MFISSYCLLKNCQRLSVHVNDCPFPKNDCMKVQLIASPCSLYYFSNVMDCHTMQQIFSWCSWLTIVWDCSIIVFLLLSKGSIVYLLMLLNVNTYANSIIESLLVLMKFMEVLLNIYLLYTFNCWRKWMYSKRCRVFIHLSIRKRHIS